MYSWLKGTLFYIIQSQMGVFLFGWLWFLFQFLSTVLCSPWSQIATTLFEVFMPSLRYDIVLWTSCLKKEKNIGTWLFWSFFEMSNASCTIHLTDERGYIDHAQLRVAYYSNPTTKNFEIKAQISYFLLQKTYLLEQNCILECQNKMFQGLNWEIERLFA